MRNFSDCIIEEKNQANDNVYVVYYDDGTMYSYYETKEEAEEEAKKLTKENSDFPASVKEEPKTNFEK